MVRRAFFLMGVLAVLLSVAGSEAFSEPVSGLGADGSEMIEVGAWTDLSGNSVRAIPVRIQQVSPTEVRLSPLPDPKEWVTLPDFYLRLSAPQIVSATLGVILASEGGCDDGVFGRSCQIEGALIEAEPGIGGGKVSLGYIRGRDGFLRLAVDVKATLLRTWGPSLFALAGQTFAGGEVDFQFLLFKVGLGVLKRLAGPEPGQSWILTGGIGVGF